MDVTFLTNVIRHILERDNFVIDFEESDEQNIHFWHRDEPFRLFISEQTENYLVWTVFENEKEQWSGKTFLQEVTNTCKDCSEPIAHWIYKDGGKAGYCDRCLQTFGNAYFTNADDIKQNLHLIDGSICFITDETGSDWWIAYEGFKRVIARLEENPDQKVEMYKPEYPVFKWEIHFLEENNSASFKFKDDFASGIVPKGRKL
ncbi:hypothetical protein H7K20_03945 [Priestia aryabhattai]|uniref:DUF4178 domain-containing protein n=1 Tax=Priestia aryabhattai TaxID=412384 RepID=A0ABD7WSB9_PRIAR|nr:hypothetical protein [Priestia aryabhattai]MBY0026230.1 hypothetical protein [Priestia aryabhattai]WEA43102.1 hypothetical protein PWO00_20050 [Priestia aryabhattai]